MYMEVLGTIETMQNMNGTFDQEKIFLVFPLFQSYVKQNEVTWLAGFLGTLSPW